MAGLPSSLILTPLETRGRPRKHRGDTAKERDAAKHRDARAMARMRAAQNIAVLDFETNPFDNKRPDEPIVPFCACLFTEQFGAVHIWDENFETFIDAVCAAIEALPEEYTVYAHNGGKFDYMFLMHRLTGRIQFMGRQMLAAKLGKHKLRDSLKIIPIALKEYKKDDFDYTWLRPENRQKRKLQIQQYMENDCVFLCEIVKAFIERFGAKLTIGQAAFDEIKKNYQLETLGEKADETLRTFFYGGRVDCVGGRGRFVGPYKLYDVNSMYPYVMAFYQHPVGADLERLTRNPTVSEHTCFLEIECNNLGAFPAYDDDGKLSFTRGRGHFRVSIHEYEAALELGLISRVRINAVINCRKRTNFSKFVLPIYEERFEWKDKIKDMEKRFPDPEALPEYWEAKRQDLLVKFLLNNGYGKFAQNPRKFKDSFIRPTDLDAPPPPDFEDQIAPAYRNDLYEIWEKPTLRRRYNNVATAASITGAARAVLLRGLHNAVDPIYCDTDSIICLELQNTELHPRKLGAWDLESEFSEVLIAGKKLYACRLSGGPKAKDKVRSKGLSDLTYRDIEALVAGDTIVNTRKGVTISKDGRQMYLTREARATVDPRFSSVDIFGRKIERAKNYG